MSKAAREQILARIRDANARGPRGAAVDSIPEPAPGPSVDPEPDRGRPDPGPSRAPGAAADLFAARAADYRAGVHRVGAGEVKEKIEAICAERGVASLVLPSGFPADRVPEGVRLIADGPELPLAALDGADGVLTTCRLAIAVTGTVVLDSGPGQGRRAATLVPDLHICLIESKQILPGVEQAFAELADAAAEGRPITMISGPSATSDIELSRVEGVHGPRTLELIVVE